MSTTRKKLISLLANNNQTYISGEQLSTQLNITRSAIWKHMNELKKDGYIIEGKPNLGYRFIEFPNKLSENTIQWGLDTSWLGKTIVHQTTIGSTQQVAHQLALEGADHGTVVIADQQTNSKGRLGRNWHSTSKKGIWMSIILRPTLLPYKTPQLTLVTATILADVINNELQIQPQIKWPNDLLINSKKVSGILTEMQAEQDHVNYVIVGIGINVNQTTEDLHEEIKERATSLFIETNKTVSLPKFVQSLLRTFEKGYTEYLNNGFPTTKAKWESYGFKINEPIWLRAQKKYEQVIFKGIAEDGALLVKTASGMTEKIYSGEIDWFKKRGD